MNKREEIGRHTALWGYTFSVLAAAAVFLLALAGALLSLLWRAHQAPIPPILAWMLVAGIVIGPAWASWRISQTSPRVPKRA